jgi:hypothetical protein
MTRKGGLRLLLVLSCLSSLGCAGFGRPHLDNQQPPKKAEQTEEDKEDKYLKDLEKDLSLYSD